MYTIVVSGPAASEQQVRTALVGAGITVRPDGYSHGLPDGHETRWTGEYVPDEDGNPTTDIAHLVVHDDGRQTLEIHDKTGRHEPVDPGYPVSFVTCEGDLERVMGVLSSFPWVLRRHFVTASAQPLVDISAVAQP